MDDNTGTQKEAGFLARKDHLLELCLQRGKTPISTTPFPVLPFCAVKGTHKLYTTQHIKADHMTIFAQSSVTYAFS